MNIIHEARFRLVALTGAAPRPTDSAVHNDEALLVKPFRAKLDLALEAMRAEGHDPIVFETLRSLERARELAAKGVGVVMSMHCYGLAADVIERTKLWGASSAFWLSLRDNAEKQGLTSGARFLTRRDLPHVQAVPLKAQAAVRARPVTDSVFLVRIAEQYLGAVA